jgi:hypothetical protein
MYLFIYLFVFPINIVFVCLVFLFYLLDKHVDFYIFFTCFVELSWNVFIKSF